MHFFDHIVTLVYMFWTKRARSGLPRTHEKQMAVLRDAFGSRRYELARTVWPARYDKGNDPLVRQARRVVAAQALIAYGARSRHQTKGISHG